MLRRQLPVLAVALGLIAGCADQQQNPKQTLGTILGAGVGALAGSQIGGGKGQLAAVAIGALGGAILGGEIGKSLDKADRAYAGEAAQQAFEYNRSGQSTAWRNPDSGHGGTITPTNVYKTDGQDCREYQTTVTIDGRTENATGRACRQADGTWRIVQ